LDRFRPPAKREPRLRRVDVDREVGVDRVQSVLEGARFALVHRRPELRPERGSLDARIQLPDRLAEQVGGVAVDHLRGPLVEVGEAPPLVDRAERVRHSVEVLFQPSVGSDRRHGVADPRREPFVRVVAVFREVLVDAGGDGLARHPLGARSGEQDEGEVAAPLPDGVEQFDPVGPGHVVIADDAVERARLGRVERRRRIALRRHVEPVVPLLDERRRGVGEPRFVVDEEDADRGRTGPRGRDRHRPVCLAACHLIM